MDIFLNGAKYLRLDCHLHTNSDKEFKYTKEENKFIQNYINKLIEEKINIGIITNHNKFNRNEFINLKRQALKKDIYLLPGVELSVKEGKNGIHVLVVFSEDWIKEGKDNINKFLDSVFIGIDNRENENTRCTEDLIRTINKLDSFNCDYFLIFAHVDNKSGLLSECDGGLIKSLFENEKVKNRALGFQKSTSRSNYSNFVNWTNLNLAKIEGSDPKCIDDIGKGTNKSYIKIGNYDFKTIKYALSDFENRVSNKIENIKHGFIESIKFNGGILDGKEVYFSPELNNIIGIRGSGKSAILEIIRDMLNINCSEVDKDYKEKIVKHFMGAGGVAELKIVDKLGKKYIISKHFSDDTVYIIDEEGNPKDIKIELLLNNILYFGQKDLSIRIDGYEEDLLNKLIGKSEIQNEQLKVNANSLIDKIKKINELNLLPEKLDDEKKKQNTIKEKLKIFEANGVKDKLEKEEAFNEDGNRIESLSLNINEIHLTHNQNIEYDFNSFKSYASKYNENTFSKINKVVEQIEKLLERKNIINEQLQQKVDKIDDLNEEYKGIKSKFISEFEEIKRELNLKENLDGDTYLKLKNQLSTINENIKKIEKQLSEKENIKSETSKLFKERRELIIKDNERYIKYVNKINSNQENIKIEFIANKNKEKFIENLKQELKGTNLKVNSYNEIAENFIDYLGILEDIVINNSAKLKNIVNSTFVEKIQEKLLNDIENVCNYKPNNKVIIKYHEKNIENYSLGQRASAVLLFILAQQDNDLIMIDQPEDDMDNQVIYKELIKTIKTSKKNIQFIFTTHNPNIPVLGDAEEVISLKNEGNFQINNNGIDNESIQKDIVDIMEGGQEAFDKREKIYNEWKNAQINY